MLQKLSLFVAMLASVPAAVGAGEPPMNVLVMMTGEQNVRTLGCYRELMSAPFGRGSRVTVFSVPNC